MLEEWFAVGGSWSAICSNLKLCPNMGLNVFDIYNQGLFQES